MRKTYKLNDTNYEIIENYKDGFVFNELESKFTDYFYDYDYVLGDWAYGKLIRQTKKYKIMSKH